MNSFSKINLLDLSEMIGRAHIDRLISDFSCPLNPEVEKFFRFKALEFSTQRLASTYAVFAANEEQLALAGYFALSHNYFLMDAQKLNDMSKRLAKRISKFTKHNRELNRYAFSAPLIGQLGKNYADSCDTLITGNELLKIACDTVDQALKIIGGKMVCLECEDKPVLVDFYRENGFQIFNRRKLESEDKDKMSGEYLLQMLKYLV